MLSSTIIDANINNICFENTTFTDTISQSTIWLRNVKYLNVTDCTFTRLTSYLLFDLTSDYFYFKNIDMTDNEGSSMFSLNNYPIYGKMENFNVTNNTFYYFMEYRYQYSATNGLIEFQGNIMNNEMNHLFHINTHLRILKIIQTVIVNNKIKGYLFWLHGDGTFEITFSKVRGNLNSKRSYFILNNTGRYSY